ncbi:MAG: hypothetical protein JW384_02147 [Nitrosomonadaceae bacterium]|nr:hypothetical protein [Nitrosomonadaceae bacterium]
MQYEVLDDAVADMEGLHTHYRRFIVWLAQQPPLAGSTIETYARSLHGVWMGQHLVTRMAPGATSLIKKIKQLKRSKSSNVRKREAILPIEVSALCQDKSISKWVRCFIAVGFGLGIRPCNIAPGTDVTISLQIGDISITNAVAKVRLRLYKNSRAYGSDIRVIPQIDCAHCPVRWIRWALAQAAVEHRTKATDSLFPQKLNPAVAEVLRRKSAEKEIVWTPYSLRIGNVTALLANNVDHGLLMRLHGWNSEKSVQAYERVNEKVAALMGDAIATHQ